jgi:VanZ family protein
MNQPADSGNPKKQSNSRLQTIVRYGPLLLWIGFIFFASTNEFSAGNTSRFIRPVLLWLFPQITEDELTTVHLLTRKAAHFFEYAVLAFLARRAFVTSARSFIQQHWFAWSLVLIVLGSLLDELHQSFVPSRTGSIYDSVIDVAGGLTVLLIGALHSRRPGKAP